jgi:hypothetical protein
MSRSVAHAVAGASKWGHAAAASLPAFHVPAGELDTEESPESC